MKIVYRGLRTSIIIDEAYTTNFHCRAQQGQAEAMSWCGCKKQ